MLPIGKLDSELLREIVFNKITLKREEVKIRAGIGEDCAVIDFGNSDMIISTDPITAAVGDIGKLAMHISCNDIASNGIEPIGIMLSVMLPIGTTKEDIEMIMEQAGEVAKDLNVEIVGGHTEVTGAVNKPVIVSTAFGKKPSENKEKDRPCQGDAIIMTKHAGIEGIGIIASDMEEKIQEFLTEEEISEAKAYLEETSVVKEGVAAGKIGVCQMHDITEGGILGAVWEMCQVFDLGAEIKKELIPISNITKKIGARLEFNPYRLISSGCMLIIVKKEKESNLIKAIETLGIKATKIGELKGKTDEICMDGEIIDPPESDELYKVL